MTDTTIHKSRTCGGAGWGQARRPGYNQHPTPCPGRFLRFRLLGEHTEDPPRGRCFWGRPELTGNRSALGVALRKEVEGRDR